MSTTHAGASAYLEAARALAPLIERDAERIEQERRLTPAVLEAMQAAGLFRMLVPRSLGGGELPLPAYTAVLEEVAKADASTAWCLSQNCGICRVAAYLPREGADEVFGPPEMILSWGNGPSSARRVEGGYLLNARLVFSSGMHHATWLGCQDTDIYEPDGSLQTDASGARRRGTFFFPRADVEVTDVWQVSGLRGTGSDSYSVTDLFVPERRRALDQALEPGPLYIFSSTNIFAAGFASVALGIARASLDAFVDLAATKSPRGINGILREQPAVQQRIAQAEATWRAAHALHGETLAAAWRKVCETRELTLATRVDLRLANTYAMQRAAEVVDVAYNAAGSTAIFNANAFERRFRDIHAATQHIQARDDHYQRVGQFLLGLDPDRAWL